MFTFKITVIIIFISALLFGAGMYIAKATDNILIYRHEVRQLLRDVSAIRTELEERR